MHAPQARLSTRLLVIALVCIVALATVAIAAGWSNRRVAALREAQDAGMELLLQTNRVHGRLKDLMFDMFSPQTYGLLKDLVHVPRAAHLLSTFNSEVEQLRYQYDLFFESEAVQALLTDDRMLRDYDAARTIGNRAFVDIARLQRGLRRIEADAPIRGAGLYRWVVLADLPDTATFLQDVRSVSYYFSDTFERLLVHVIYRLNEHSDALQERTLRVFWLTTVCAALIVFLLPLFFALHLTRRLFRFQQVVESLGEGNLHVRALEGAQDEVGSLLRRFNTVAEKLSRNIDSVSVLMRRVGRRISENPTLESLFQLIADTTAEHEHVEAVAIIEHTRKGDELRVCRSGAPRADAPAGLAHVTATFRLPTRARPNLVLQVQASGNTLTDLDLAHLRIMSEYATLLVEHNDVYRELLERRQAAYHALQAQIQPHFLFNVLGGMFGLNRAGDTLLVERSLICLRNMLQYIVGEQDVVTLAEEFAFTRSYLELQTLRFGDRLEVTVELHDTVADISMPKLVLQPLVENAVTHGIEPKVGRSRIQVSAHAEETGGVLVCVRDDGVGLGNTGAVSRDGNARAPSESRGLGLHIGISNVRDRLLLTHPGTSLEISEAEGGGTIARIRVPASATTRAVESVGSV